MYRLLLTLCLGEFVFPAIVAAAAAPPATSCDLYAQQGGGLAERFKQLDRNGDGKLSREEAGSAPFFRAADKDGDGFLTFAEAEAHARQSAGPAHSRTAGMEGDGAGG